MSLEVGPRRTIFTIPGEAVDGEFYAVLVARQFVHPFVMRAEQEDVYDDHYFTAKGDWVEGVWSLGYVQAEHKVRGGRLQRSSTPCEAWWATSGDRMRRGLRFGRDSQGRGFEVVGIELNATMATNVRTALGLNGT